MIGANHDALTLHVAVEDFLLVQVAERVCELLRYAENNILRQRSQAALSLAHLFADDQMMTAFLIHLLKLLVCCGSHAKLVGAAMDCIGHGIILIGWCH